MSKRLQVLLPEEQYEAVSQAARRQGKTVAEWVRELLRAACRREPAGQTERKLAAIREAVKHEFPTGDIEQMLEEIEAGYTGKTGE